MTDTELEAEPERIVEDDDELEKLGVKPVALEADIIEDELVARIEANVVGIEEMGVAAEADSMF